MVIRIIEISKERSEYKEKSQEYDSFMEGITKTYDELNNKIVDQSTKLYEILSDIESCKIIFEDIIESDVYKATLNCKNWFELQEKVPKDSKDADCIEVLDSNDQFNTNLVSSQLNFEKLLDKFPKDKLDAILSKGTNELKNSNSEIDCELLQELRNGLKKVEEENRELRKELKKLEKLGNCREENQTEAINFIAEHLSSKHNDFINVSKNEFERRDENTNQINAKVDNNQKILSEDF